MPWSAGTFSRTDGTRNGSTVWAQAKAAAVKIISSDHDTHDQDLATGINAALNKNGENSPTVNINWGGFKITNLANGTTSGDALHYGQIGAQVQAYSALLAAVAALTPTDSNFIVGNGTTWVAESGSTVRTSLGLGTAAVLDTGTSSGNIPLLGASGMPAVAASLLTALNASALGSGTVPVARLSAASDTAAGIQENADQSEMEAGSSTTLNVTPGRQHFHPSAAKFWVKGINTTVNASYNVTSLTDNGTGDWTVTIANDLSSANYAVAGLALETTGFDVVNMKVRAQAAGTVQINAYNEGGSAADPDAFFVIGFGDI